MADPINLDSLVRQASDYKPIEQSMAASREKVAGIQRERDQALEPEREKLKGRIQADQADADKAYQGIDAVDYKPWKEKPPEVDPLTKFGSLGSVFGSLASAFTHQPWQSSMNAMASAINAARANELDEYRTAYDAWKENTKLMLERHDAQHKDYAAAQSRMRTDIEGGTAMLRELGAKYGDKMAAALTEAGMDKDLVQLLQARDQSARGIASLQLQIQGNAVSAMSRMEMSRHNQAMETLARDNAVDARTKEERRIAEIERHNKSVEENRRLEIEHKADKNSFKQTQAADNYGLAIDQIDDLISMASEGGVTGLAGDVRRRAEGAAGMADYLLGTDYGAETPAKNFQSKLDAMKLQLPKLLTGASKSAKDERLKIDTILRGTNFGDTKPATINALRQVREMLEARRSNIVGGKEVLDDEQAQDLFGLARQAIAAGAPRDKVIEDLKGRGLEPPPGM